MPTLLPSPSPLRLAGLAALVALVACGSSDGGWAGQAPPSSVSAWIGPAGGIVELPDGTEVSIPPGALAESVEITLAMDPTAPVPPEGSPIGATYLVGPEGQKFLAPVKVTLALAATATDEAAASAVVYTAPRESDDYVPLETTMVTTARVSAETTHFSHFVALRAPKRPVIKGGSPHRINIGWNGPTEQFDYYADFFQSSEAENNPGPRLCHWYIPWNIACSEPTCKDDKPARLPPLVCPLGKDASTHSLEYLACWLHEAQIVGHCEDALLSFKGDERAHARAPSPGQREYKNAMEAFFAEPWREHTGFRGSLSFTPWNEPNNADVAGDGLGHPLSAEDAATYYLTLAHVCEQHGGACKVAAGDFASNGEMWKGFEFNCATDDVPASGLCRKRSAYNTGNRPKAASYLDRYKNYIHTHRDAYHLSARHPAYFAFHGWHDINVFLQAGSLCRTYDDCAQRMLSASLSEWPGIEIWDTETGVGQKKIYGPEKQACGAAFLLDLTAADERITRMYFTRLHNDDPSVVPEELFPEHRPTRALDVLAARRPSIAGKCWKDEKGVGPKPPPPPPPRTDDVCCARCAGQTTSYYAAEAPEPGGQLQSCAAAATAFCQFTFDGAGVTSAAVGSCGIYEPR